MAGRLFGEVSSATPVYSTGSARFSGALLVVGIIVFFTYRVRRYQLALKALAATRLEPEELRNSSAPARKCISSDLRHPLELLYDPFPHCREHTNIADDLTSGHFEIPRDRDIVLYCTCPSEATAAKTAMTLHKMGIERVRPLRGGFDEWKRLGFPLEPLRVPNLSHESSQTV